MTKNLDRSESYVFAQMGPEIIALVEELLGALGINQDDANFVDTPRRVARYLLDACRGYWADDGDILNILSPTFPSKYDQMIIVPSIEAVGICPHHLLPVEYSVDVGYLPNTEDKTVVGISKIPRLVKYLAAQPVMQEDFTEQIAFYMEKALSPLGVGVVVTGRHACMRIRGVRQDSPVVTSIMKGAFFDVSQARSELLSLIQMAKENR